jgi:hypothetical protein
LATLVNIGMSALCCGDRAGAAINGSISLAGLEPEPLKNEENFKLCTIKAKKRELGPEPHHFLFPQPEPYNFGGAGSGKESSGSGSVV